MTANWVVRIINSQFVGWITFIHNEACELELLDREMGLRTPVILIIAPIVTYPII